MGHVLGKGHEASGLMAQTLAAGTRSTPMTALEHAFKDRVDWTILAVTLSQEEQIRHRS